MDIGVYNFTWVWVKSDKNDIVESSYICQRKSCK